MIKYEIREYFAERLKQGADEHDLRLWYVAYYADTSEAFLRSCLKLKKLPRLDSLILIAELFQCTVNELLGYKFVDVEPRTELFNQGIDTKRVVDYFMRELSKRGFELDNFQFNEYGMDAEFRRCIRNRRFQSTDAFLQICDALDCTPSDLLGY